VAGLSDALVEEDSAAPNTSALTEEELCPLQLSTVRLCASSNSTRPFTFEVITPMARLMVQAPGTELSVCPIPPPLPTDKAATGGSYWSGGRFREPINLGVRGCNSAFAPTKHTHLLRRSATNIGAIQQHASRKVSTRTPPPTPSPPSV
jgi:hypothetical protein